MGGGGTTSDHGESQSLSSLDIAVSLESQMFAKYPDTAAPNYKTLSKRIVQSLKTNAD